jgi:M6 family metalloprotease-like protein
MKKFKRMSALLIILMISTIFFENFGTVYANAVEISSDSAVLDTEKECTTTKGAINNICVFIRFQNQDVDTFEREGGYEGFNESFNSGNMSLKNYIKEVSYNQLDVNTQLFINSSNKLINYVTPNPLGYYQPYSSDNTIGYTEDDKYAREQALVYGAMNYMKSYIPTGVDFDNDNDGEIDNVTFIYSNQVENNQDLLLWPHMGIYSNDFIINGLNFKDYNFITTKTNDNFKRVITHEFMHTIEFPDLYSSDFYSIEPVGPWSIMSSGFTHPTVYEKNKYGKWINDNEIKELKEDGSYALEATTSYSSDKTMAYRINVPNSDEYFMIEYREETTSDFEDTLDSSGLIFYRINPAKSRLCGEINVFRDGAYEGPNLYDSSSYYPGDLEGAAYDGSEGKDKFNDFYLSDNTSDLGINVYDIIKENGKMNFKVTLQSNKQIEKPKNVTLAKNNEKLVGLTWNRPKSDYEYFEIYRDGQFIGKTTNNYFDDTTANVNGKTYIYEVSAYSGKYGESERSNSYKVVRDTASSEKSVHLYYKSDKQEYVNFNEVCAFSQSKLSGFWEKYCYYNYGIYEISEDEIFDQNDWNVEITEEDLKQCEIYTLIDGNIIKGYPITSDTNYTEVAPLEITSIDFDKSTPQAPGEGITVSVNSKGGAGEVQYRFFAYSSEEYYNQMLQLYSKNKSVLWTPKYTANYKITVYARDEIGNVATKTIDEDYVICDNPIKIDEFKIVGGGVVEGERKFGLFVNASGGTGTKQYKYVVFDGNNWTTISDYSYTIYKYGD